VTWHDSPRAHTRSVCHIATPSALGVAGAGDIGRAGDRGRGDRPSPLLQIVHFSWTERYGHFELGYLVLALGLWMAVRYWRAAPPGKLQPDGWAVLPLLGLIAVLGLFELMFINSGRAVLLPLLFIASVALVLGRPAAGRLFWPAMFIYFALPQWWAINGLLQSLTSAVVTRAVAWTGIPAFIEGNFVHVPAGLFEIASGCSGLNYLLSGLALGAFLALMYLRRWKHRFMVLAVAAVLAIVSNWIRVYTLVFVGYLSDMQHYLITVEHHTFGWVLFLVLMAPVVLVQRLLEGREARDARAEGTAQVVVPGPGRPGDRGRHSARCAGRGHVVIVAQGARAVSRRWPATGGAIALRRSGVWLRVRWMPVHGSPASRTRRVTG
jgi:exosortase